ncbi:MAG: flagellar motor switch protein FliN [bacterium]|nr:flagellar motor switch protein FliN [bacterium]
MTDEKDMEFAGAEGGQPDAFPGAGGQDDQPIPSKAPVGVVNPNDASEEDAEAAMLRMLEDLPQENRSTSPDDIDFGSAPVARAEFQQLQQPAGGSTPRNLDLLMDVDLPVAIELGRTKMSISEILALGPGSVVELNKLAGEPVDLLVNSKVVAKGEVVVIDENFGLRITQLITPEERLKALGAE